MRVAIVTSNAVGVAKKTKKGTEIFVRILLNHLVESNDLNITAFASSDSSVPTRLESLNLPATSTNISTPHEKYILFELALISKAFSMEKEFDLYHINIGDGDIVLPFARYVNKPILITIHHIFEEEYLKEYFSLFKDLKNVYLIPISNSIKKYFPKMQFLKTIYHGIEEKDFYFDKKGANTMLWAGRGISSKGLTDAFEIARTTRQKLKACIIRKASSLHWLNTVVDHVKDLSDEGILKIDYDVERKLLIKEFQQSKLFLFPIQWEEPFGLVLIESMACGTPVVAYARGSVPEVVEDGKTGFLVNPSKNDIRGDYIIKKTGIDGMIEAVEKIFALPEKEYALMRLKCRQHVERNFTATRMAEEYAGLYRQFATR